MIGDKPVSPWVRDLVVIALWLPVIILLVGTSIAVAGLGVQVARAGTIPDLSWLTTVADPTVVVMGVGGAVGYLYYVLLTQTFGAETVEEATEQATDAIDDIRGESDD